MKDRSPLFMGPSDIDWLVPNYSRSGGLPRTFLSCCYDEDPVRVEQLEAVSRRAASNADIAIAMKTSEVVLVVAVVVWRALRAFLRPVLRERTVVVRVTDPSETTDVSEAA